MGAPWSGRQDPAWHDADQSWYDGLRPQHADDYLSCPADYKALRPGGINLKLFHPTRRMLMPKLSPSFNEAASVLAGPGISELIKGPTHRYLGRWRRRT